MIYGMQFFGLHYYPSRPHRFYDELCSSRLFHTARKTPSNWKALNGAVITYFEAESTVEALPSSFNGLSSFHGQSLYPLRRGSSAVPDSPVSNRQISLS